MTERKRLRKSKLVPRDLEFSSDEIVIVQKNEIPSTVANAQTADASNMSFNVEVEVEEFNEADSGPQWDTMVRDNMSVKSKHLQMVLQNITDITELRSSLQEYSTEGLSLADKLLLANFRNYLGKCLSNPKPTRTEQLIEDLFEKYKHSRLNKPETLNFYKCYICNLAWWHLYDFREHLEQHIYSDVKLDVECMVKTRNIIAFQGFRPESKFIDIDSSCPRCSKSALFHLRMQCELCKSSFNTCAWYKTHEYCCIKYQNYIKTILATETDINYMYKEFKCKICTLPFFSVYSFEEHMLMAHSVRSDLPMDHIHVKKCLFCHDKYVSLVHHPCPMKCENVRASGCNRAFHNMAAAYLHREMAKKNWPCRVCGEILGVECEEWIHIVTSHTNNFKLVNRCLICPNVNFLLDDYSVQIHFKIWHRQVNIISVETIAVPAKILTNEVLYDLESYKMAFKSSRKNDNKLYAIKESIQTSNKKKRPIQVRPTIIKNTENAKGPIRNRKRPSKNNSKETSVNHPSNDWTQDIAITIKKEKIDGDHNLPNTKTAEVINKNIVKTNSDKPESEDFELQIAVSHITKHDFTNNEMNSINQSAYYIINKSAGTELQLNQKNALNVVNKTNDIVNTSDTVNKTNDIVNTSDTVKNIVAVENTVAVENVVGTVINVPDDVGNIANHIDNTVEATAVNIADTIDSSADTQQEAEEEDFEDDIIILTDVKQEVLDEPIEIIDDSDIFIISEHEKTINNKVTLSSLSDFAEILADGPITQHTLADSTEIVTDETIRTIDGSKIKKRNNDNISPLNSKNSKVILANENNLKRKNKLISKKPKEYYCKRCNFRAHYALFKRHKHYCRKSKIFPNESCHCSKCGGNYNSLTKYLKHLRSHGFDKNVCPVCNVDIIEIQYLKSHILAHIRGSFLKLLKIDDKSSKVQVPNKKKLFQCKICKVDVTESNLFTHWDTHLHSFDRILVKVERKDFLLPQKLYNDGKTEPIVDKDVMNQVLQQLQSDKQTGLQNCMVCDRNFKRKSERKRHLIEHLLVSAYSVADTFNGLRCEICFSVFKEEGVYKQHMREHGCLTIYKCCICYKMFSDSSNFAKHKKVHDLQAYTCDICKRKFSQKASLAKHIQDHKWMTPKQCEICLKVFFSESRLNNHKKHHYGGPKAVSECKICRITFTRLKGKWHHMWVVHKQRKDDADCPICQAPFRIFSEVRRHCLEAHNYQLPLRTGTTAPKKHSEKLEFTKYNFKEYKPKQITPQTKEISKDLSECKKINYNFKEYQPKQITSKTKEVSKDLSECNPLNSILVRHGIFEENQQSLDIINNSSVSNQSTGIAVRLDITNKASDNSTVEESQSKVITVSIDNASRTSDKSNLEESQSSKSNCVWAPNLGVTIKQEKVDENYEFTEVPNEFNVIVVKQEVVENNECITNSPASLKHGLDIELPMAVPEKLKDEEFQRNSRCIINKEVIDRLKVGKRTLTRENIPDMSEENMEKRIKLEIKDEPMDMDELEVFVFNDFANIIENSSFETSSTNTTNISDDVSQQQILEEEKDSLAPKMYSCKACKFKGTSAEYREHKRNFCVRPQKVICKSDIFEAAKLFPCSKCQAKFSTSAKYLQHLYVHGIETNVCPICQKSTPNIGNFMLHMKGHISSSFVKLYQIADGMELLETRKMNYHCKTCERNVELNQMFEHWESHFHDLNTNNKMVKSKEVVLPQRLYNDGRTEPIIDKNVLKLVIDDLQTPSSWVKKRKPFTANQHKCLVCERSFGRHSERKRHFIEHLLSTAYSVSDDIVGLRCEICFDVFDSGDKFKQHMRGHASLTMYKCNVCLRTFSDSSNFAKHKKVHNISVYVCDLCNSKFTLKISLEKHIVSTHMLTEPLKCDLCDKIFHSKTHMKRHRKKHEETVRYTCKICRVFFNTTVLKLDHMWEVHKQRKAKADCPICEMPFRKLADVKKHCRTVHDP